LILLFSFLHFVFKPDYYKFWAHQFRCSLTKKVVCIEVSTHSSRTLSFCCIGIKHFIANGSLRPHRYNYLRLCLMVSFRGFLIRLILV
jgi:hypothetical protein